MGSCAVYELFVLQILLGDKRIKIKSRQDLIEFSEHYKNEIYILPMYKKANFMNLELFLLNNNKLSILRALSRLQ